MLMMLPFEAPTIFEQVNKSWFRMPRVVKDQRNKFDNDDLFRQLSHESAVKYTGFKDRPLEERQMKFITNCQEGHTEVSVVQSGNQFTLMFNPTANPAYNNEGCDFDKELGKVHIKSGFILNGVCVLWRGWIDLQRLEGFGCLEFDEYRAYLEDAMLKQQIEKQQTCNSGPINHHSSPLNRLNHHTMGPGAAHPLGALNPLGPAGLNPCLGGLVPPGVGGPPSGPHPGMTGQTATSLPPVSLADSAAHYGTAAIAAAAAAFHQAFGVAGPGGQAPGGLGGPPTGVSAAAAAAAATVSQHMPYTNGMPMTNGSASSIPAPNTTPTRSSPSSQNNGSSTRSPDSEQQQQQQQHHGHHQQHSQHRSSLKRAPEEQTQLDDVDVATIITGPQDGRPNYFQPLLRQALPSCQSIICRTCTHSHKSASSCKANEGSTKVRFSSNASPRGHPSRLRTN